MDERFRQQARDFQATGEVDPFFVTAVRADRIEPAAIELLARLGYPLAIDYYYQAGGKKLGSHALTLKFIKTVHQLLLIRMIGAMLLDGLTEIFGTIANPKSWYSPVIEEYTGASPEEIKQGFWALIEPLLSEPLGFAYPLGERMHDRDWGDDPEIVMPQYTDFFDVIARHIDEVGRSYGDDPTYRGRFRGPDQLENEGVIDKSQQLLFELIHYFVDNHPGKRSFWNIFNPRRSLVAPNNMIELYDKIVRRYVYAGAPIGPFGWQVRPEMQQALIHRVIGLVAIGGYPVEGKDRRTRYTRAADEHHAARQQQSVIDAGYGWEVRRVSKRSPEMVLHKGQWLPSSTIKAKTLPKPEVILQDIAQIFDETPIKTYPFNLKHRKKREAGRTKNIGKLQIQRTIYLTLGRNISNSRANASKKVRAVGLIGSDKPNIVTAWTGIATRADLDHIISLLETVHGVDKVVITRGDAKWTCPACDWQYEDRYRSDGTLVTHVVGDIACRDKRGWKKRLGYF